MNSAKLSIMIKASIIVFALCGIIMCAFWYPFSVSLTTMGTLDYTTPTVAQNVRMWSQIVFYWVVSIPCFVILWMAWKISNAIKNDVFFSLKVAKLVKCSTVTLFIDIIVFFVGNVVFLILKWNDFYMIYFLIAVVGLAISSMLLALSHFIVQAAGYKEEVEGLLWS